jgi:hypothetical protein
MTKPKIQAIMSCPRLGFTGAFASTLKMVAQLGIGIKQGQGAFWGQVLQNIMETSLDDADYLLTLDYDTWFLPGHVRMLHQLATDNPTVDVLVSVQEKQSSADEALFLVKGADGQADRHPLVSTMRQPLVPLVSGHFGCTLIRTASLAKLPKPWFQAVPNEHGEWHEGKIDDDIWFWHQCAKAGLSVQLASRVFVGHLQQVCTFPDVLEHNFTAVHVLMKDLDAEKLPMHVVPDVPVQGGK